MARGEYKRSGQSGLRARFHDFNSQRRYRGQSTVSWDQYKKTTKMGGRRFSKSQ